MSVPPKTYAYRPQARAVGSWIALTFHMPIGPNYVYAVDESGEQLRGMEDGVFLYFTEHMHAVPPRVFDVLRAQGFTTVAIDDSNPRRRHHARTHRD